MRSPIRSRGLVWCCWLALALPIDLARAAGCAHCGCSGPCRKVCRVVCEEKKVDVVCWGMECEDFCLACPGKRGCKHCETVCQPDPAQADQVCTKPKKFIWREWFPCGAKVHTKVKLMKKVETKKVPTYKFVVEDLCEKCQAKATAAPATEQK